MGISSKSKPVQTAPSSVMRPSRGTPTEPNPVGRRLPQAQPVAQPSYTMPTPSAAAPVPAQPFQFAPRPATVQPYVTPLRTQGSGTGAQNAFSSRQPVGYDPVASFLASLPPLGAQAGHTLTPMEAIGGPLPAAPTTQGQQLLEAILSGK